MADYTVSLNNKQETALDRLLAEVNAQRAAETPPKAALTKQDYMSKAVTQVAKSWAQRFQAEDLAGIEAKLQDENLTAQQIAQVKTVLGLP